MRKCRIEHDLKGYEILVWEENEKEYWIGSRYDVKHEASVWSDYHLSGGLENVILVGMGNGQVILECLERIPGEIIVYEPKQLVYDKMMTTQIWKKIRKNRRIKVCCEKEYSNLEPYIRHLLNQDSVECTRLLVHPMYNLFLNDECERVNDICSKACNDIGFMKSSIQRFIHAMIENQLNNISYMRTGIPIARLKKYWDKDIPIIMVSAGPSLEKNVLELKRVENRAWICCVDAAITTLLKHNIVPDLLVSTDAMKNLNCFEDERCREIPLLVTTNTATALLKMNSAVKIWGDDHAFVQQLCEKAGIELPQVPFYSGVATALFASLLELGAKQIILVGQDLAYGADGKSHVTGRDEGFVEDEQYIVDSYHGGKVQSRGDWIEFLKWFENAIRVFSHVEVINATEGGARIHGTKQKRLSDVIDALPQKPYDFNQLLSDERVHIKENEWGIIEKCFNQCYNDIIEIEKEGYYRTFFETEYTKRPVMRLILDYMKSLDHENRQERFESAISYVKNEFEKMRK